MLQNVWFLHWHLALDRFDGTKNNQLDSTSHSNNTQTHKHIIWHLAVIQRPNMINVTDYNCNLSHGKAIIAIV